MDLWVLIYMDGGLVEDVQVFATEQEARDAYLDTMGSDMDLDEDEDTQLWVTRVELPKEGGQGV